MKDTMLELVKICQEKEFLCIHDNVDDLMKSALNSKLLLINSNSQRLDKKEHEVKNVAEQPAEHGNQPEHLLSMGYEHLSITPETESDEVIESNAENLLPIPSKCEVTLEDKRECDMPISENSPVCDNHSDTFSDSKIDDDISVYDDDFEDIEYVEASLSDHEIVNVEEENVVQQEEEKIDLEDISQIQDVVLREKLLSITRLISNIESLNDNSTPDRVLNSFESNNSLSDNFSPEFETFCDHSEETRSEEADLFLFGNSIPPGIENVADDPEGDIHFLEELLIDDSILSHQSFASNFEDNLSIPRPPPKPPDAETDAGEEISVVMNDKDEDIDYSSFIFVMFDKVFSLLSTESEDIIFDPGTLTNLTVEERFAFNVSLRMFTRSIVIQRRVEDLQLGVESYQKKLNLTMPDTYKTDLKCKEAYTVYSNSRGFIYQNKDKQNRLMQIDELHKFSDRTLNDVRTA
uniref:Retrovirus-related Pol polyprotein from transposon TNT 1-94 n=1 Tax=Tanacetum cinerariifolium TaxID=118510 RepID=A0A6L2KK67_TANCI|nr:hypothetical protein [Tanacetum cinerariifolium]